MGFILVHSLAAVFVVAYTIYSKPVTQCNGCPGKCGRVELIMAGLWVGQASRLFYHLRVGFVVSAPSSQLLGTM